MRGSPERAEDVGAFPAGRLAADAALVLVTFLWGFTFVAVKEAVARVPVFTFLTLRFTMAAVSLAAMVVLSPGRQELAKVRHAAAFGSAAGLFLFGGYALQTAGLQWTSASRAGFITGLSVAVVPILESLWTRRPPAGGARLGVGLVTVGLALMYLEPSELAVRRGDLLVLACALAFAAHVMAVAHLGRRQPSLAFSFWQALTVALLSLPGAAREGWRGDGADAALAGTLLLTGVLVSGVMLAVQAWGQRHTSATHAAVIFALEPVFAALAGLALAGEVPGPKSLFGGAVIVAGTLAAELDRLRPATSAGTLPMAARGPQP